MFIAATKHLAATTAALWFLTFFSNTAYSQSTNAMNLSAPESEMELKPGADACGKEPKIEPARRLFAFGRASSASHSQPSREKYPCEPWGAASPAFRSEE